MKKIDFMEERRSFAAELIPPGRIPDALLSGTLEHLPIPGLCILINPTNYTNYTPLGIKKKTVSCEFKQPVASNRSPRLAPLWSSEMELILVFLL